MSTKITPRASTPGRRAINTHATVLARFRQVTSGLRIPIVLYEGQPASTARAALIRQSMLTVPLPLQSNAGQALSGAVPRAMSTPRTRSAMVTTRPPPQSPVQSTGGVTVDDAVGAPGDTCEGVPDGERVAINVIVGLAAGVGVSDGVGGGGVTVAVGVVVSVAVVDGVTLAVGLEVDVGEAVSVTIVKVGVGDSEGTDDGLDVGEADGVSVAAGNSGANACTRSATFGEPHPVARSKPAPAAKPWTPSKLVVPTVTS